MPKKAYQLQADHSSFTTTLPDGSVLQLTPDKDTYETSDFAEQQDLDATVAVANSGLKKAEKK